MMFHVTDAFPDQANSTARQFPNKRHIQMMKQQPTDLPVRAPKESPVHAAKFSDEDQFGGGDLSAAVAGK